MPAEAVQTHRTPSLGQRVETSVAGISETRHDEFSRIQFTVDCADKDLSLWARFCHMMDPFWGGNDGEDFQRGYSPTS